jgi:hypothetical protein
VKKIIFPLLALTLIATSCREAGTTDVRITGDEANLPTELKGLKIYSVATGYGSTIKVAVFENQVVGSNYPSGKHRQNCINVYKQSGETVSYPASSIIVENDSILVIKKK